MGKNISYNSEKSCPSLPICDPRIVKWAWAKIGSPQFSTSSLFFQGKLSVFPLIQLFSQMDKDQITECLKCFSNIENVEIKTEVIYFILLS